MANSLVAGEENYGFNLEWIAEGSGIGEEICGVDKDCIVVPSSPILTKIEPVEIPQHDVDEYVEIQVTEEEVITDQWNAHNNGSEDEPLHFRVEGNQDDVLVPLPEEQDEYSRLHPYPCDFCSRRFSKKSGLTVHMLSHQVEHPHECNLCGLIYNRKVELVEHMKMHAYVPVKAEEEEEEELEDDYDHISALPPTKTKQKSRRKKKQEIRQEIYHTTDYGGEHSDDKINKKIKKQNSNWNYLDDDVKMMVEMARQAAAPKFPIIDPSRPYVCQHCGVGFAREKALNSHTMVHIGDSAFECDFCHEMFQNEQQLDEHMMMKHEKQLLNVNKRKNSYGDLRLNVSEETYLECHVCTLCNLVFNNFDELLCHKEDHDPEIGIHACYLCNDVYETVDDLKRHMKSSHRYFCVACEKIFKDEKTFHKHNMALHPEVPALPCNICHRKFNNKIKLRKHLATHEDKKHGLLCNDCEQEFTDGQTLLTHRQMDHGVNLSRLFPCMECGKTFNSRSSQQIHIRIHTGEKPYGCRYCWKAFGDGGTLRKHERIHTGEKPYVCPVCSKAFNQRVVLREHIRAHHSGTEGRLSDSCYECIVCGSMFVTSRDLYSHLVQHSDENTAKHRFPSSRKYTNKKKKPNTIVTTYHPLYQQNTASDESSHEDELYNKARGSTTPTQIIQPIVESPIHTETPDTIANTVVETSLGNGFDTLLSRAGPRRARILRSGKKGVPKGQNKRFAKGKGKSMRLLNNASYASKYVVSQPDEDCINDAALFNENDIKTDLQHMEPSLNGSSKSNTLPKSRPRTKNVSYHNMRQTGFEIATFPMTRETNKVKKIKKGHKNKNKKEELIVDTQFVNGIDTSLFDNNHDNNDGEQIETCIVDDIDVELKLEVKTTEDLNLSKLNDILIKTEIVSCDMCSESFDSHSELLKHIQIHI